jgi:hypothetical protein
MRVDYVRVYWRLGARKKGIGKALLTAGTVRMPNADANTKSLLCLTIAVILSVNVIDVTDEC